MDFRIITLKEDENTLHHILLERVDDDGHWVVFISAFFNLVDRYEEWYKQLTPVDARNFIVAYSESQAIEFMNRAKAWYDKIESSRRITLN